MSLIKKVRGCTPVFGKNCFIAENATVVGDFVCGDDCSFWFNSVVRADVNSIIIGNRVNVQDGAVLHCTFEQTKTIIGNDVSIGHNAIVHGCRLEDNVLIGMGAIVMDNAIVRSGAVVAAGAVVLENTEVASGMIYGGIPAKPLKKVDQHTRDFLIKRTATDYVKYGQWFKESD